MSTCLILMGLHSVLFSALDLTEWYIQEVEPRWEYARAEGLILSGENPVVIGMLLDTDFDDREGNRVFLMREYDLSGQAPSLEWDFTYEAYSSLDPLLDDDGYDILTYRTGFPLEERFLGVGFTRTDLGPDPVVIDDPSGLAFHLDDDGDTVCPRLEFTDTDWADVAAWDVVYIGDLGSDSDVYATCGWYALENGEDNPYGFIEIATEDDEIELITDESVSQLGWTAIDYDSDNDILIVGGFKGNPDQDGLKEYLQVGCIDLHTLEITEQQEWRVSDSWRYIDGPLVVLDDGIYAYIGNCAYSSGETEQEGFVATLWSWNSSTELEFERAVNYLNATGDSLEGYSEPACFDMEYLQVSQVSGELILLLNAIRDSDSADCFLICSIPVNLSAMTLGGLSIDDVLVFDDAQSGWSADGREFVFTSLNPVEGIGAGGSVNAAETEQQIMLFEIEDD